MAARKKICIPSIKNRTSMRASTPAVVNKSTSESVKIGMSHDQVRCHQDVRRRGGGREMSSAIWVARLCRIGFHVAVPRMSMKTRMHRPPPAAESQREVVSWEEEMRL